MCKKGFFIWPIFLICLFFLTGCGSPGGEAVYFDTVEVSANCGATSLDSDVALWEDSNNDDICDQYVIQSDSVEVTIRSQAFKNISGIANPSQVRIENVRIDYTPQDETTPPLASQYLALGQFVWPDDEIKMPIMVVNQEQKGRPPLENLRWLSLDCSNIYTYLVKLTFSGVEVASNKREDFSTNLTIQVADFVDECERK